MRGPNSGKDVLFDGARFEAPKPNPVREKVRSWLGKRCFVGEHHGRLTRVDSRDGVIDVDQGPAAGCALLFPLYMIELEGESNEG